MRDKTGSIVRYFVLARCKRCGRKHNDFDNVPQRKDKRGKPIPHTIECDTCLYARVGPEGYARYLEVLKRSGLDERKREQQSG